MWVFPSEFNLREFLFLLMLTGVFTYITYRYWFDTEKFVAEYRKGVEKTPKWYPFRSTYLKMLDSKSWIWLARFLGLIALISVITMLTSAIFPLFASN